MPLVPVKRIIAVSSEDEIHRAQNLLLSSGGMQWLSAAGYRGKKTEVELELAKPTRIEQVEVGNCGSAFVEVLVKKIDEGDCVSLLPQSILMSSEESRTGRNQTRIKVFPRDKLSKTALDKKWSTVIVCCTQPYVSSKQFGLKFIRFSSTPPAPSPVAQLTLTPTHSPLLPLMSPRTPQAKSSQSSTKYSTPQSRTPSLPTLSVGKGDRNKTFSSAPRRLREINNQNSDDKDEFSGIEKQSRLLKYTLKSGKAAVESNSILERIVTETKEEQGSYSRRKLLHKELPKVAATAGVDFTSTYGEDGSSKGVSALSVVRGLSRLDNSTEFGEDDPDERRGWKSKRKKSESKSRSKKHKGISIFFKDVDIVKKDTDQLIESPETETDLLIIPSPDTEQTTVPPLDTNLPSPESPSIAEDNTREVFMNCPVCGELLPDYVMPLHASWCAENKYSTNNQAIVLD